MKNFIISETDVVATKTGVIIHVYGFTSKKKAVDKFVCTDKLNQVETIKSWAFNKFGVKRNLSFAPIYTVKKMTSHLYKNYGKNNRSNQNL